MTTENQECAGEVATANVEGKWKKFAMNNILSDFAEDPVILYNILDDANDDDLDGLFDKYDVVVWRPYENLKPADVVSKIVEMATSAQSVDDTQPQSSALQLRLVLDVGYNTNGSSTSYLKSQLSNLVQYGMSHGLITGDSVAEVETYSDRVEVVTAEARSRAKADRFSRKVIVITDNRGDKEEAIIVISPMGMDDITALETVNNVICEVKDDHPLGSTENMLFGRLEEFGFEIPFMLEAKEKW